MSNEASPCLSALSVGQEDRRSDRPAHHRPCILDALAGCLQEIPMVVRSPPNVKNYSSLGGAGNHINLLLTIHYDVMINWEKI